MMKQYPKVTIVTPSYNQGEFIEETIQSVLNQTYPNIEYIIFDACSTDNTCEILEKYKDRVTKIIIEKDQGQSDAINKGFKLASGEFVGWLNSDDILSPNCIENIVETFQSNINASIVYASRINIIDRNSFIYQTRTIIIEDIDDILKKNSSVIQPGSFYKRRLIEKVNYLDVDLRYCMDLDLWLKLLKVGKVYRIDSMPLASFRYYEETKSHTGGIEYSKERRRVLKRYGASVFSKTVLKSYLQDVKVLFKV